MITRAKPAKGADDEGDRTEFIQLAKSVKLLAAIHSLPDHDAI